ncbi:MAG: sulfotransferase family protein [Aquabacterium sp.]|nr:sulfotransferase family protein [Aquabacterium sp.]
MNLAIKIMQTMPGITSEFIQRHKRRLGYGSFVGDAKNYVYLETPKAACSTMKQLLMSLEGRPLSRGDGLTVDRVMHLNQHDRKIHKFKSLTDLGMDGALNMLTSPDVVRFCVVRNPYARLVSAWSDKIHAGSHLYTKFWGPINAHNRIDNPHHVPIFREFVQWLDAQDRPETWDGHWRSMTALLFPDTIGYTHVLRTETLAADLQTLLARIQPGAVAQDLLARHTSNEGLPRDWQADYDEEIAAIVGRLYADDFKTFGYDLDSWKISDVRQAAMQTAQYWREKHADLAQKAVALLRHRNEAHGQSLQNSEALLRIISNLTGKRVI